MLAHGLIDIRPSKKYLKESTYEERKEEGTNGVELGTLACLLQ